MFMDVQQPQFGNTQVFSHEQSFTTQILTQKQRIQPDKNCLTELEGKGQRYVPIILHTFKTTPYKTTPISLKGAGIQNS